jgi:hypothetical protein
VNKKEKNNMFGSKGEKLPGPREIPGPAKEVLTNTFKLDPDAVQFLKAVIRKKQNGQEKEFDIRIYDEGDTIANKVEVKNYTTLDDKPNLVLWDGWYNEKTKKAELTERNKLCQETTLFSLVEIQQKIEGLTQPGSTVFFYMARGPGNGGPLGRGASVIELVPKIEGKKQKKYTIYGADVVEMQPVGKGNKIFDSDKTKEIATWVKEAHHKRCY